MVEKVMKVNCFLRKAKNKMKNIKVGILRLKSSVKNRIPIYTKQEEQNNGLGFLLLVLSKCVDTNKKASTKLKTEGFLEKEKMNMFSKINNKKKKKMFSSVSHHHYSFLKNYNRGLFTYNKKSIKAKKEDEINKNEQLLEWDADEMNNIILLLKQNKKALSVFKILFILNWTLLILFVSSVILFFNKFVHKYILAITEKTLEELRESKEVEKQIKELIDHWIEKTLQEEQNKIIASTFFVNMLKHSEKEIGDLFIKILKMEHVEMKLKNIFADIAAYLSNNNNVQQNVSDLLIQAISLPKSIEFSKQWLVNLFNSDEIKTNLKNIVITEVFKSEQMKKNAALFMENVIKETLKNKETQQNTKLFFSSIISNQQFQQQISESVWKILKLTVSPKWFSQEDLNEAIKQREEKKQLEIKKTQFQKSNKQTLQEEMNEVLNMYDEIHIRKALVEGETKSEAKIKTVKDDQEIEETVEEKNNATIEEMIDMFNETNKTNSELEKYSKENEMAYMGNDMWKEIKEYISNVSVLWNSVTLKIFSDIDIKTKHIVLPMHKIKKYKIDFEKTFLSYLLELLESSKCDSISKYEKKQENIENEKETAKEMVKEMAKENLIKYSLKEKIHLTLIDLILYYSYKYYFYYYYIKKVKLVLQNILQVET